MVKKSKKLKLKRKKLLKQIKKQREIREKLLKQIIEKKKANILAKIEDKIPSTFVKEQKQSYIGKGGLM